MARITQSRVGEEIRTIWPNEWQQREQEAWDTLVTAEIAFWSAPAPRRDADAFWEAHDRRYRAILAWKETRARRLPTAIRRAVLAKFEAEGRICGTCGQVVTEGETVSYGWEAVRIWRDTWEGPTF